MPVTIHDVAQKAGVSIKTVSRVINHESFVTEKTKLKVLGVIEELGYLPNMSAQQLARRYSGLIGLLFSDATPAYIMSIINGMLDYGDRHDYRISLNRINIHDEKQIDHVISLAAQKSVEGFVITPPCDSSEKLIDRLSLMPFPFILLTPKRRDVNHSWVAATDELGSYEAARYLLKLGHTRIGFIQGNIEHQASWDRLEGYRRAMLDYSLEIDDSMIRHGDWTFYSGLKETRSLLTIKNPPTAVMAGNDQIAAGVIQAAWELGLACPDQLSVIGFDDVALATEITPPLTTIRQPIYDIARTATEILIEDLLQEPEKNISKLINTELVVRHSTQRYSERKSE